MVSHVYISTKMKQTKASASIILATIFLDALGIGILLPVLPSVIARYSDDPVFIAQFFGYFLASYSFVQFFASPTLGALSDRYGRRPILLISLAGSTIEYLLMAFAPSLWLLFVGRILSGLTGASVTVASSYVADVSEETSRAKYFGMIGAAFGVGMIFGPALGGFAGLLSPLAPFLLAAGLNLLNFMFGYFVLPESLPTSRRRDFSPADINPFRSVFRMFRNPHLSLMLSTYTLLFLADQVLPSIWTLYTKLKFNWSPFEIGLSLTFAGVLKALSQGGLTRLVIPKIGEMKSLQFGVAVFVVSFILFGIADQSWMIYSILILFSLSGLAFPALQSLLSKNVSMVEQGTLQGTLVAMASLMATIGPVIYTKLFSTFTSEAYAPGFPGAPFLIAAGIAAGTFLLLYVRPPIHGRS